MGTGLVGEVEVSIGTPCVAAEVLQTQPHQKSPPWCAHGNKKLLGSRTIYRKRLGLILKEKKRGEEDIKIKIIFFGRMRKPKVYGRLVNEEMYLQFRLIEHNGMGG